MLALALQHKWACKASMQEVYRRFGRPPTDLVHDHFTHCLKSWCLCHSCCSAKWFAKGLTNLFVSNVCYIVSWIRTDSKMHQNCTQLIFMVRSYPKKKNNNNERKPVLTVIGIKKKFWKNVHQVTYQSLHSWHVLSYQDYLETEWMSSVSFCILFSCIQKTTLMNKYTDMGQVIQSWGQIIQGYFEIWFLIWKV